MGRIGALSMRFGAATVARMTDTTAADLGRAIAAGDTDPVDLTESYLAAINAHPERDRIFTRVTSERALAEAEAARGRAQSGRRLSPLDGVPISWKDLYDTAGVATEAGTPLLAGRVPTQDARVLESATRAGLVCLGKTHMTELAFSGLGYNAMTATPPNAIQTDLAPGGSSSGAAASTGLGLCAAGIGSDTGGSIRAPAAWNDLVGFKPTHRALPLDGVVPLCPRFDTPGPLCHSVEDAALLFQALGGPATDLAGAYLDGARFLVLQAGLDDTEDAPRSAFENAVARLQAAGAVVEDADLTAPRDALALSAALYTAEAYANWGEAIEAEPEKMFKGVRDRFLGGATVSAAEYLRGWQKLEALRDQYVRATAGYDAVLLPTCPIMPPKMTDLEADVAYFTERNLMALRNTRIGNLMGLTAVTLPTGVPMTGLMLMASPGADARLLRLAKAAEMALT